MSDYMDYTFLCDEKLGDRCHVQCETCKEVEQKRAGHVTRQGRGVSSFHAKSAEASNQERPMSNHTVKTKTNGSHKLGSPSAGDIYRKAAWLVESGQRNWSCCAIEQAVYGGLSRGNVGWSAQTQKYREMFSEDGRDMPIAQFDNTDDGENLRVLALCFMAAIDDSERPARPKRAGARRKVR